ncbi:MAG: multicopper oxidase domain-containing protein [Byssovorax sp.]
MALGLFGALIVHAPDEAPANEHVVVLSDFDQNEYEQLPGVADPVTGEFPDGGTFHDGGHQYMHTINRKAYEDAVPPFKAKVGEISRWRVVSIGQEFHTWHIHGHRWLDGAGQLTDNVQLGPGSYTTFEFKEDNPGSWLVHCHVTSHMEVGMMASYIVSP